LGEGKIPLIARINKKKGGGKKKEKLPLEKGEKKGTTKKPTLRRTHLKERAGAERFQYLSRVMPHHPTGGKKMKEKRMKRKGKKKGVGQERRSSVRIRR